MKQIYSFCRPATFLLTFLMSLPLWATLPEENRVLDLGTHGIGEIITIPELEDEVFYVAPGESFPKPQSAYDVGDWGAYTQLKYTDQSAIWGTVNGEYGLIAKLEVNAIWCMNNGTDHIYLTQYVFDSEYTASKQINWDITVTVAGGIVEVGSWDPSCTEEDPDWTVLKDTTIHYGDSYYDHGVYTEAPINNYVGLRYVSYCYEDDGQMYKNWYCVFTDDITVTSSDPDVVSVQPFYSDYKLIGQKRGTATITVSVPAIIDSWNSEPKHVAKSVSYEVTVTGDDGPNIGFYQNYESLDTLTLAGSYDTPYWWPVVREDGYNLFDGALTVTSSNEAVATIDYPTSNEVHFTFVGYGTTTITATVPGDDYTNDAIASFTLVYKDPHAVDLFFTDFEGNRIDTINVGTDEYGEPVYPFNEVHLYIQQNGEDKSWLMVNLESENTDVVSIYDINEGYDYMYFNYSCIDFGTTDIVATFAGDGWDDYAGYYQYSPATARLTVNYADTYEAPKTPTLITFSGASMQGDEFNIVDTDSGSLGISYYLPVAFLQEADLLNYLSLPLTFTSSDESVVTVNAIPGDGYYTISFDQHDYGQATITASFAGDDTYAPSEASFEYSYSMNLSPMAACNARDAGDNILTDIVLTEGDFLPMDLVRDDGAHMTYNILATATTTYRSCWKYNKVTKKMDFYPHAAGLDTIVFEYWRFSGFDQPGAPRESYRYWPYRGIVRIPVVSMPYLTPVADDKQTTMNLNPQDNASMSFSSTGNDTYNSSEQQLEIQSVVTAENLQLALDSMATGKKEWNDLLPGATTFNLNAGKGKIRIQCETIDGYELKVLIRDHGTVTVSQPSMGFAEVNYDVDQVTAVLIYLAQTGGASPAPKRAPQATKDAPSAIIRSIQVNPDGADVPTAIDETNLKSEIRNHKYIKEGQLFILRDGKTYNATGQEVK